MARKSVRSALDTCPNTVQRLADGAPMISTIADADAVLGLPQYTGKLPFRVRTNTTNGHRMVNDANVLNNYNNGSLTS